MNKKTAIGGGVIAMLAAVLAWIVTPTKSGLWRSLELEAEQCHAIPGEVQGCIACFARVSAKCLDAGLSDCNFYDSSEPSRSCF